VNHQNELAGLEEVVKHFKINMNERNIFSRCMVCNCDEFAVISKLDLIKLKYLNAPISEEVSCYFKDPEKYLRTEIPEYKQLFSFRNYCTGEEFTKYGVKINATALSDGTLKNFQTFYICEKCAKIYWDGGHYQNNCGGKFTHIFNLFPITHK
jgi:uncharacterized protein with PIN domain